MSSKPKNFNENGALKKAYNDSLFDSLFRNRKKVIESYPKVGGGLAIPDIPVRLGDASYTFKLKDVVDKVSCETKSGNTLRARYKRSTDNFDILYKQKVHQPFGIDSVTITPTVKYEMDKGKPKYVFASGLLYKPLGLDAHFKFNPFTYNFKASALYEEKSLGLKVAGDVKTPLDGIYKGCKYNVGAAYTLGGIGLVTLAVNDATDVTATFCGVPNKNLSYVAEAVVKGKDRSLGYTVGVQTQVDSEHEFRARFNQDNQLNVCIKKQIAGKFNIQFATLFDVSKPDMSLPAFGFKLDTK